MKQAIGLILFCVGLLVAQSGTAPRPAFNPTVAAPELHLEGTNLTLIKGAIADYVRGRQYEREIAEVVKPAHDWVEARTSRVAPGEKLAAIFDIDETALSNLRNMAECDFCAVGIETKIFPEGRLTAISPVLDLYNFARSKGLAVFFITGRNQTGRDLTMRDLKGAGYTDWDDLLMRPSGNNDNAQIMKSGLRRTVESRGYKIILNIGDQLSDLAGGYSERTYKLPNPFYFVE